MRPKANPELTETGRGGSQSWRERVTDTWINLLIENNLSLRSHLPQISSQFLSMGSAIYRHFNLSSERGRPGDKDLITDDRIITHSGSIGESTFCFPSAIDRIILREWV